MASSAHAFISGICCENKVWEDCVWSRGASTSLGEVCWRFWIKIHEKKRLEAITEEFRVNITWKFIKKIFHAWIQLKICYFYWNTYKNAVVKGNDTISNKTPINTTGFSFKNSTKSVAGIQQVVVNTRTQFHWMTHRCHIYYHKIEQMSRHFTLIHSVLLYRLVC